MYTNLVNIITSYKRLRHYAGEFDFNIHDELVINSLLQSLDRGIDRYTGVLQSNCEYSAKKECLLLQLELVHVGTLIKERSRV